MGERKRKWKRKWKRKRGEGDRFDYNYVMIARRTKLVPPAKSVNLSNLREKAMEKKKS